MDSINPALSVSYSSTIDLLADAMKEAAAERHVLTKLEADADLIVAECTVDTAIYAGTNDATRKANLTIHLAAHPQYQHLQGQIAVSRLSIADADMRVVIHTQRCRLMRLLMTDAIEHSGRLFPSQENWNAGMLDNSEYNPNTTEHGY